jgi:uncharacterized protein YkwD
MKKLIFITIATFVNVSVFSQIQEGKMSERKDGLHGNINNLDKDSLNRLMVIEINKHRKAAGLTELTIKTEFQQHCKEWGEYLIKTNQYIHATSFPTGWLGECIYAGGFHTIHSTYENFAHNKVSGWKNSPRHWEIIMNRNATMIGVYTSFSEVDDFWADTMSVLIVGR